MLAVSVNVAPPANIQIKDAFLSEHLPGTPIKPLPSTFTRAIFSILLNPQTHLSLSAEAVVELINMRVPLNLALNVCHKSYSNTSWNELKAKAAEKR